jgi:hypothetical protein
MWLGVIPNPTATLFVGNTYQISTSKKDNRNYINNINEQKTPNDILLKLLSSTNYLGEYRITLSHKKILSEHLISRAIFLSDMLNDSDDQTILFLLGVFHHLALKDAWNTRKSTQDSIKKLLTAGLSMDVAESFVSLYGKSAWEKYSANPLRALTFSRWGVSNKPENVPFLSESRERYDICELLRWFESESYQGRTVIELESVPRSFINSLRICTDNGWIKGNAHRYQLLSNFILETVTRTKLQQFNSHFHPSFSASEIESAYNRIAIYDDSFTDICTMTFMIDIINRKILNISSLGPSSALEFITPTADLLNLLTTRETIVVVYSENMRREINSSYKYLSVASYFSLPFAPQNTLPKTYFVLDFDLYNFSDLHTLLNILHPEDQLIVVAPPSSYSAPHQPNMGTTRIPSDQFRAYFPSLAWTPQPHQVRDIVSLGKYNNYEDLVDRLRELPRLPVISPFFALEAALNKAFARSSTCLIKQGGISFSKGDYVLFEPLGRRDTDSTLCELVSISGGDLFVKSDGRYLILKREFVLQARKTFGHAISHIVARKTYIKNAFSLSAQSIEGPFELFIHNELHLSHDMAGMVQTASQAVPLTQTVLPQIEGAL